MLHIAGYSWAGVTVPTGIMRNRITLLKSLFLEFGVDVAFRVDLNSPSRVELLRALRRYRNLYDIIAVGCANPRVATVACRDRRVDIVFFNPESRNIRFTHPLANLLRGLLELNVISALLGQENGEALRGMMKQAAIAREHNLGVVVSSGSKRPETVRGPSQMAALAGAIGLSRPDSLSSVSSKPLSLIKRNALRRSPQFIEEGVKVMSSTG